MSSALNNVPTGVDYTTATTLRCPGATRINFDIANAAVYYQLGHGTEGILWGQEVFATPGFRSIEREVDAVRVRSANAGQAAQVTVEAVVES